MDDRLVGIATRCANTFRWHPDHEDLLQIALLTAWQHDGEPARHIGFHVKLAIIDELRRIDGRRRPGKRPPPTARGQLTVLGIIPDRVPPVVHDPVDRLNPSELYALDDRLGYVADRLADGALKETIADELGVTPGAVSHRLHRLRRAVVKANRVP